MENSKLISIQESIVGLQIRLCWTTALQMPPNASHVTLNFKPQTSNFKLQTLKPNKNEQNPNYHTPRICNAGS